jgi:toxin-antitoxin system PIN domain toxin
MKIIDLNVLLYAINRDSAHHEQIRDWWENAVNSRDEPLGLPWIVLLSFLRLSTNPRIFPEPLATEQAMEKVEAWLAHPNIKVVRERRAHWNTLKRLLSSTGAAGNLTTDAHLAALAISYGAALVSCDPDFARFRELRYESPLK